MVLINEVDVDPLTGPLGQRFIGANAVLGWLHANGWKVVPPEQ